MAPRDRRAARRILDHLGLSTPQEEKPPPIREIVCVGEHGEGWGVPAAWDCSPSISTGHPKLDHARRSG
jgi:hypothetical protein